jgi:4,5-dihydroxyphthalate decarboxylase
MMNRLQLNFACWDYDRMRPLMDGRVQVDGVALNFLNLPVEETFFRQARYREFEVSEMSLSSYCISLTKPE